MNIYTTKCYNKFVIVGLLLLVSFSNVYSQTYQVNGSAIESGNDIVRLTAQGVGNQVGTFWNTTQIDLNQPYDKSFEMFFGCDAGLNGGDGMTFTLQNDTRGLSASGAGFGFLGIGGSVSETITPSLSIEFDTFDGSPFGGSNEIADDHIAINLNGDVNVGQPFIGLGGALVTVQSVYNGRDLEDCAVNSNNYYTIRIVWDPIIKVLTLYEEGVLTMTYNKDIVTDIFGGNSRVYWGFTGATGSASNEQWIAPAGNIIPWECAAVTTCCAAFTVTPTGSSTICNNPITLSVSGTYTSYRWSDGSTASTTQINAPGTYTLNVLQNQGGNSCPGSATFTILSAGPTAAISGDTTLCNTTLTAPISVTLTGSPPWSLTHAINGVAQVPITGITTSPYVFQANGSHVYTLINVSDNNGCNSSATGSATVDLYADVPVGHDGSFVSPGTANLSVDNNGAIYSWYDAPTAGNLVYTGNAFTTPVLTATTTYYVESSNVPAVTQKTVALLDKSKGTGIDVNDHAQGLPASICYLEFTAKEDFILDEITCLVNVPAATTNGRVTIYITPYSGSPAPYVGLETVAKDSINISISTTGQTNIVMPLNYVCTAGTTYHISYSATNNIQTEFYFQLLPVSGVGSYPLTNNPELSITQYDLGRPGSYPGLFNWKISQPSPASLCGSTPVTAFICPLGAVIGNDTTICSGNAVLPFIQLSGSSGSYTYQWQFSANNITFAELSGATNSSYQSPNILTTTYFRRIDKSGNCMVTSNTIVVNTTAGVVAGSIQSTNPSICYNTIPPQSIINVNAASNGSGGNGSITYQWQQSPDGINWNDILGADGLNYTEVNPLLDTTYYRRKVGMGLGNCDTTYTDPVKINVYAALVVGSIENDTSICSGSNVNVLEVTPATGSNISYQWISSVDKGVSWVVASGNSIAKNYTTPALTDTTWYKRVAITPSCGQDSSNVIHVSVIARPLVTIGHDTTICSGNAVLPFTELTGGTGSYTYQWQFSANNITFAELSGATNSSYQSPIILITTYFRRIDKSVNCMVTSDTIVVNTTTGVVAGSIQSINPSICYNTIPPQSIINVNAASNGSGGNGSITYQWQQSPDGINWNGILGANGLNYTEVNPLLATTYYRRKVGMGLGNCDTSYTVPVKINVYAALGVGSIGKDTSICSGTTGNMLELSPATGSNISYQWVSSVDKGASWVVASGNSTAKGYTTPALTDTTWYRRVAINPLCGQDSSNVIQVSVIARPIVTAGNDTTVVKNSVITLQGNVTGSQNYQWIPSIGLSDATILRPSAIITKTITYKIRAEDISGACSTENSVTIFVINPIVIPNVITINGDGVNDTWEIANIADYLNVEIEIYNRWGNIVWKSTGYSKQWDGTNYRNGEVLPDGTYFYIMNLQSQVYSDSFTGWIQIVK